MTLQVHMFLLLFGQSTDCRFQDSFVVKCKEDASTSTLVPSQMK